MAYEQKESSYTLFKNDKKPEGSNQPDWRGDANFGGVIYEFAGWNKQGARGEFISGTFKVKEEYKPKQEPVDRVAGFNEDDDIPF